MQLEKEDKSNGSWGVISGHTTHGSFVSPGLCNPANLYTVVPVSSALMIIFAEII